MTASTHRTRKRASNRRADSLRLDPQLESWLDAELATLPDLGEGFDDLPDLDFNNLDGLDELLGLGNFPDPLLVLPEPGTDDGETGARTDTATPKTSNKNRQRQKKWGGQ